MAITVVCRTDEGVFTDLAGEWDALAALVVPRRPFVSALWNRLWWAHYRRRALHVRDSLRVHVLRDETGVLVAIAPMMLTRRPAIGPLRSRELQFFGADTNLTEIRGMVCRPGREMEAVRALADAFERRADWDWIQWHGLPSAAFMSELHDFEPEPPCIDHVLALAPSWEAQRAAGSRNLRESLRRSYNSLSRDGHPWRLQVFTQPADLARALPRWFELHTARAQAPVTPAHPDAFAETRARRFIAALAEAAASGGDGTMFCLMFALEVAGSPVAMRMAFVVGDSLYLYYSGFDPAWGQYGVMTTLVAEAVQWAIGSGLRYVNFSTGIDRSKTRWRPDSVVSFSGCQLAGGVQSRIAFAATVALRRRRVGPLQPAAGPDL